MSRQMKRLILLLSGAFICLVSCKKSRKANEFHIYISEDNPGWHFVDLLPDTIHKGYHKVEVRFEKGQMFQQAKIRSDIRNYPVAFLYENGDTLKTGLWFSGEDFYDTLKKVFISFYLPSPAQKGATPGFTFLGQEKDSILEDYMRRKNILK